MAEGKKLRMKSVREIFNQARSLSSRVFGRTAKERIMDTADKYADNIRRYLGEKYSIDRKVPVDIYMGRNNNR